MIKIPNLIELLIKESWPPLVAMKTFDKSLSSLIMFLGVCSKQKVKIISFQESSDLLTEHCTASLFSDPYLWIISQAPSKLSIESQKLFEQAQLADQKIVLLASHDFKDKSYEAFLRAQYFSLCALTWKKIGEFALLKSQDSISWPSYPDIPPSIELALDLFQYAYHGLSSLDLPQEQHASLENASWLMFEQCLKLRSAEHLTYKQIFSFFNYLESIHLWFLSDQLQRRSIYIPASVKKYCSEKPVDSFKYLEHFYLLALEAQQEHEYEKTKFLLSLWLKNFSEKSTGYS